MKLRIGLDRGKQFFRFPETIWKRVMLDGLNNNTLCCCHFGDSQRSFANAIWVLGDYGLSEMRMSNETTMVPIFCHAQSYSYDQSLFDIHCHLRTILATEGVARANVPLPSIETSGHEAKSPSCILRNLSPLWTLSAGFLQVSTCRH